MASTNPSGAIARIAKELTDIQKGTDLSIAVACQDSDVRYCRALIVGPPDTPYEFGFFEFQIKFPRDYPIKCPHVKCMTTNNGRTRFNPNIYADGKICLSILGTWRGNPGEEWSSAQGLESLLLSIQSLMSSHPYENEPGFEEFKKEEPEAQAYIAKIQHETLRIAVIQQLERLLLDNETRLSTLRGSLPDIHSSEDTKTPKPPLADLKEPFVPLTDDSEGEESSTPTTEASTFQYDAEAAFNAIDPDEWDPFVDSMKRRFLWYYDPYMTRINLFSAEQNNGESFEMADFEYGENAMRGKFDYKGLKSRLERLLKALNEETASWARKGEIQVKDQTQLATQLAFTFKQLKAQWNETSYSGSRLNLELKNIENPFIWEIALFGCPSGNLEGGILNMTLHIPPDFPDSQPRLRMHVPIFHRQVNSMGTVCYLPTKPEELSSHLQAIVEALDDVNPAYDPRAVVNPEAFKLYWGGDGARKLYNRRLRRSVQEASELC